MRLAATIISAIGWIGVWAPLASGGDGASPSTAKAATFAAREPITDADRDWWAFQPVGDAAAPAVDDGGWSANPIDRFVFRRLAGANLSPAPQASKTALVRRLYFDLVGLPPTPEQIDQFLYDTSADAWERLVDRLLADPRYGEHWARYWLDLVRYAESDGWNQDAYRPHIWRYRDYVVRAFNEDKPYPEFVRQQLAGDEILRGENRAHAESAEHAESVGGHDPEDLAATGYLRLGIYEYNQRDARTHWHAVINEITDVTADVFLGLGLACAKCHDHKFDPILQADYYKLRAFFEPLIWRDDLHYATETEEANYEKQLAVWKEATSEVRAEIDALLKPYNDRKWKTTVGKFPLDIQACFNKPARERTSWEHQMAYLVARQFEEEGGGPLANISKVDKQKHEALLKELAEFDELRPEPLPPLMAATDFAGPVSPTVVPDDPEASPVEPGCLTVLNGVVPLQEPDREIGRQSTGRRTALAQWIASPDNPLTTRVIVNRIWQHHFGRGLVATSSDFGRMGERPTHPELLDWLTRQFVENGWSFKHLHRLILTSATWRQSSRHPQAGKYQQIDPAESLLWRSRIRRLTAEQIRDAMLAVTGELDETLGGPSVEVTAPRRSLYVKTFRNAPPDFLCDFDVANGLKSVPERNRTTTPIQALLMINGQFAVERGTKLAARLRERDFATAEQMLTYGLRLTWGRAPSQNEMTKSLTFVGATRDRKASAIEPEKLSDFCHVLLNSNEFLYVD